MAEGKGYARNCCPSHGIRLVSPPMTFSFDSLNNRNRNNRGTDNRARQRARART